MMFTFSHTFYCNRFKSYIMQHSVITTFLSILIKHIMTITAVDYYSENQP